MLPPYVITMHINLHAETAAHNKSVGAVFSAF